MTTNTINLIKTTDTPLAKQLAENIGDLRCGN